MEHAIIATVFIVVLLIIVTAVLAKYGDLKQELEIAKKELAYLKESRQKLLKMLSECYVNENTDCNVGEWCRDCVHSGKTPTTKSDMRVVQDLLWLTEHDGEVWCCKRHLHEVCPEWKMRHKKNGDT